MASEAVQKFQASWAASKMAWFQLNLRIVLLTAKCACTLQSGANVYICIYVYILKRPDALALVAGGFWQPPTTS